MEEKILRTGFELGRAHLLRETSLYDLLQMTEDDVKKGIGQKAKEAGLPRDDVLEFVQYLTSEIATGAKEISDMVHNITFK